MSRRLIVLTEGFADLRAAKTAISVIRYCPGEAVAVLDAPRCGQTAEQLLGVGGDLPVVGSIEEAPPADTLLIGVATPGGVMPEQMREHIRDAVRRGMTVESGLHEFLSDDPELVALAERTGATLKDVRRNSERRVTSREGIDPACLRLQTVGNDCSVGKMVTSLELTRALQAGGEDAAFVATGQTGIMIAGDGCPIDCVVGDFINGAAEGLVLQNQHHRTLVIEGQGSLVHPRYSSVTLGLLHGAMPDGLILCYEVGRRNVYGMDPIPLPPLREVARLYETVGNVMHPCRVIGVALNSRGFSHVEAEAERRRVEDELGLPACDVLRHGPGELVEAVAELKRELGK